jgi:exosome complex component MTR3
MLLRANNKFDLFAVMQTGPTTAASGSAYAEFGKTKVIVSV